MKAIDELLFWAQTNNHPLYERYLTELYEDEHGPHFDECTAKKSVSSMYHTGQDGIRHEGEHWNIEQIRQAIQPYRNMMDEEDTCWDAYVAIHAFYHDLYENYRKRSQSNADSWIIEDAMTWAFADDDAPEDGKIWVYINAM